VTKIIGIDGPVPKIEWSVDMAISVLYYWLRMHPELCVLDPEIALRIANKVLTGDMRQIVLLTNNKCQDPENPEDVFREGFAEKLEEMYRSGCEVPQVKEAMKRFKIV